MGKRLQTEFHPSGAKPGSQVGSKASYTHKACGEPHDKAIEEEDMDLKKEDSVEKSLSEAEEVLEGLAKALRAATISSLTRRERMDVAYQAGVVAGMVSRTEQGIDYEVVHNNHIQVAKGRPMHEPREVPKAFVQTPFHIPAQKCEDPTTVSKSIKAENTEALPYWKRV